MSLSKIRLLLLYAEYTNFLSYFNDWKDAFINAEEFEITPVNVCNIENTKLLKKIITDYDLIVALHSTNGDDINFIIPYGNILNSRKCKLLTFVGNELNYPHSCARMGNKISFLKDIQPEFIATQVPLDVGQKLYEDLENSKVVPIPHALNPKRFKPKIPQEKRPIDIGVRSARYYPFLGDNERINLIEYFLNNNFNPPLVLDISMDPNKRFPFERWPDFLNSCKGTITTEVGGYYLEKDDATVLRVFEYIKSKLSFSERITLYRENYIFRTMPKPIKALIEIAAKNLNIKEPNLPQIYYSADFKEIYELFFKDYKNPLNGKAISSRHFDAIGTKTCQIMFPGRFNDILIANEHYISLNRDYSNIDDVLRRFRDVTYRNKMVDGTYEYVMDSHTYRNRIQDIVNLI